MPATKSEEQKKKPTRSGTYAKLRLHVDAVHLGLELIVLLLFGSEHVQLVAHFRPGSEHDHGDITDPGIL